jgi:chloramphenicol O-acetyltransferase type A
MSFTEIDMATWPRANQFRLFRGYAKPHFATTVRLCVTALLTSGKARDVSPYRACLYAIGAGIDAVPELRTRFSPDDSLRQHDRVGLSMTVPTADGGFNFGYVFYEADFARFDRAAAAELEAAANAQTFQANDGVREDVVYLSCLPWIDYTAINNAISGPDDCIPRVSWGKFTQDDAGRWRMPMTLEVHHAIADGAHVGAYFNAVQAALDQF